jgi:hypothetical protein
MQLRTNEGLKIELLSGEDQEKYNKFVFKHPDSTIYHSIEWKKIIQESLNLKPYYLLAKNEEDKIEGVLPLFHIKTIFNNVLSSLPLSSYGGFIGERRSITPLLNAATMLKKDLRCNLVIRQKPLDLEVFFNEFNLIKENLWNLQRVNIKNPQEMWYSLDKTNRTNIRKAEKNGLYIKTAQSESDLTDFYHLFCLTYKRLGFCVPNYHFFKKIWEVMSPLGYLKIFIVKLDELSIGSTLNLTFRDTVFSAYIGLDERYLDLKVSNYLDWNSLLWCYKKSFCYYDLGLTTKENKSLFSYKSSFSSEDTIYSRYVSQNLSNINKHRSFIYNIVRHSLRKTPVFLNKKLGTFIIKNLP